MGGIRFFSAEEEEEILEAVKEVRGEEGVRIRTRGETQAFLDSIK